MHHPDDPTRLLQLTLLGDRRAAQALKLFAQRRNDALLLLAAEVVLRTVPWVDAHKTLLETPFDAITPELYTHLNLRLLGYRQLTSPSRQMLANGARPAILKLVTHIWISSADCAASTWSAIISTPLASARSMRLRFNAKWLQAEALEVEQIPWFNQLVDLSLSRFEHSATTYKPNYGPLIARMARLEMPALKSLELSNGDLDSDAIRTLCKTPWSARLKSLKLNGNDLSTLDLETLAQTPYPALHTLHLYSAATSVRSLSALAQAPFFLQLQHLGISERDILEAVSALPEDALAPKLLLMSQCARSLRPSQQRTHRRRQHGDIYPAQTHAVGAMFRAQLSQIESTLHTHSRHPLITRGAERALVCMYMSLENTPPLTTHEQEILSRLMIACAQNGSFSINNFFLYVDLFLDIGAFAKLCAALLSHKSTISFVRVSMLHRDFGTSESACALQHHLILSLLSNPNPRQQNAALNFLTTPSRTALRAALFPSLWSVFLNPTTPSPGATHFPSLNWPAFHTLDGLFRALWALAGDDPTQAPTILKAAIENTLSGRFHDIGYPCYALIRRPDITCDLLQNLTPNQRTSLLSKIGRRVPHPLLLEMFQKNPRLRTFCPPLNPDWPPPSRPHQRARWNTLSSLNLLAMTRAEGDAAKTTLTALLTHENPHLRDLARQCLDSLKPISPLI